MPCFDRIIDRRFIVAASRERIAEEFRSRAIRARVAGTEIVAEAQCAGMVSI